MEKMNSNKAGLAVGSLFALIHLCWIVLVGIGIAKTLLDWILEMHFMQFAYSIEALSFWKAFSLLIVTFVFGYACGWIVSVLHNLLEKK